MKRFALLFLVFLQIYCIGQSDSSKLHFDLSIRERFEVWNGMNFKNYGDDNPGAIGSLYDNLLLQRIIAGVTWCPLKNFEVAAHLQDSRAFGWSLRNSMYPDVFKVKAKDTDAPYYTMNPNEEFFEIYDAYIEYRELMPKLILKLGRQKIFYGVNHYLAYNVSIH